MATRKLLVGTPSDFLSIGFWRKESQHTAVLVIALLITEYYDICDNFKQSRGYASEQALRQITRNHIRNSHHEVAIAEEIIDASSLINSVTSWTIKIKNIQCVNPSEQDFLLGIMEYNPLKQLHKEISFDDVRNFVTGSICELVAINQFSEWG